MSARLAAVTILYNPEDSFLRNLASYSSLIDEVFVIDNSEVPSAKLQQQLFEFSNVHLLTNMENRGIATALNQGINQAKENGYAWVLTMDQDSSWETGQLESYISELQKLKDKTNVAVIGVSYANKLEFVGEDLKEVNSVITSGSIINTTIFEELGGYLDKLFIDEVDHEYCYRAIVKDYKVLQFEHIFLQHNLGNTIRVYNLKGKKKLQRNLHAPQRLYYIVRNGMYIMQHYGKVFPKDMQARKKDILVRIKNRLLYGKNKIQSLRFILLGFYHYKQNRYGKL